MRALALSPNTMGDRYKQAIGHVLETRPFAIDSSRLRQPEETMLFDIHAYFAQVSCHTALYSIARWEA